MPVLPYETFRIESSLTAAQTREMLSARVEPPNWRRLKRRPPSFEGEVKDDSFRIWRVITYGRNSFRPLIRGRVFATAGGSIVEGTMSLHPVVLGFLIFWFTMLVLFSRGLWVVMLSQRVWQPGALVSLGMFVFAWTLTSVPFTVEANKAKALLVEMFAPSDQPSRVSSEVA